MQKHQLLFYELFSSDARLLCLICTVRITADSDIVIKITTFNAAQICQNSLDFSGWSVLLICKSVPNTAHRFYMARVFADFFSNCTDVNVDIPVNHYNAVTHNAIEQLLS